MSLGGVSEAEIQAVARAGVPEEAGASLEVRFTRKVARLVVARILKNEEDGLAIFLQSKCLTKDAARHPGKLYPLLESGREPITGGVWLTNATFSATYRLDFPQAECGEWFEAITNAGYGHLPALLVDWQSGIPVGKLYSSGLRNLDEAAAVGFDGGPIAAQHLKSVLDRFHTDAFRSPNVVVAGHAERIWNNPAKGVPVEKVETKIQRRLLDNLRGKFALQNVRAESENEDGRADLVIWRPVRTNFDEDGLVNEWVLELKALCDMTSTGKPKSDTSATDVEDGLEQAIAYRTKLPANKAALCCYDMRQADGGDAQCFDGISAEAQANDVELWRWYLHRSARSSRRSRGYIKRKV